MGFGDGGLWLLRGGGCGYGITMLNMEAVGISGGGKVEVFVVGGKVGRKGQNQDYHW